MQDTAPIKALSTELNRLSEIAARDSKVKFTSLAHLLTEEYLKGCYRELNHQAAAGIDRVSYATYGEDLEGKKEGNRFGTFDFLGFTIT